jgi:hypothetical protein
MKILNQHFIPFVQFVFNRPILAAFFVGTFIHTFFYINQKLAMGHSYLYSQWTLVENHPVLGIGQLIIPYLVPLIVIKVGTLLSGIKQQQLMRKFVAMNPDLIVLLDPNLNIEYANPSTRNFSRNHQVNPATIDNLLPSDFCQIISQQGKGSFKINAEARISDRVISYTLRRTHDSKMVFITGRDTTAEHLALERLQQTSTTLHRMTSYLDDTFNNYSPANFNLHDHYDQIIHALLDQEGENIGAPHYLFLATRKKTGLQGNLYTRSKTGIIRIDEPVLIENLAENHSLVSSQPGLVYSNWEDDSESLQLYQNQFPKEIRQQVGIIERFVSYGSGDIIVIGFYQKHRVDQLDAEVLKGFTVLSHSLKRISDESRQTCQAFNYTTDALARASEANDEDTGDHIIQLNEYARIIAVELGCDENFVKTIHRSAQMHDVGKIHINPSILKKPGKLTDDEFKQMRAHPIYGSRILGDSPYLAMASEIALNHHEKFDGSGYPHGLKGQEIPLSARIVGIIDVYDALRQKRVYKPAFSHQKSVDIISMGDGRWQNQTRRIRPRSSFRFYQLS